MMKKLLTLLLTAAFIFPMCVGMVSAYAVGESVGCEIVKTYIDVKVGDVVDAIFVCDLVAETKSISAVELLDQEGNTVSKMLDNGKKGDESRGDRVYSAPVRLYSEQRGLVNYTAAVNGVAYKEYEVNFYNEFNQADEAKVQAIYDGINTLEAELENQGKSDEYIFNAVKAYLEGQRDIETMEVTDVSICYTTYAGISSMYGRMSDDTRGTEDATNNAIAVTSEGIQLEAGEVKGNESLQSWTNPNVLCVRPYRNVAGEEGFHNDRHYQAAQKITAYTKGYITVLDNEATAPYKLLETVWQNGFVFFDSHGLTGFGNSYISVWDGEGYTEADVQANRVMRTNTKDHIWVGGSFFRYYYEQESKTLDNTFLYFGICYGMTMPSLREELFALGAVCAYGYDASVTMGYEAENLLTMYSYITKICETDTTRTYNLEEGIAECIRKNGPVDHYADTGAHLQMAGDTKFVVYKPDVAITGAEASYTELEGTVGSNCYVDVVLSPADMVYGYTEEWTSSNSDVVTIVGSRTGYCKAPGEATITGKYTYNDAEYTVSCTVTVEESMPEKIIAEVTASATAFRVGQRREIKANIYPLNVSNPTICYKSNNPGSVTVDSKGVITSVRPGKATIRAYAQADESVYADISVEVIKSVAYIASDSIDYSSNYLVVTNDQYSAALCAAQNQSYSKYLQSRDMNKIDSSYSGNISAVCLWKFVEADGGYYLYNESNKKYLSMSDDRESAVVTAEAETVFNFNAENRMYVVDNGANTAFLRYMNNRGFYFASSGSKLVFAKQIDYTSDSCATISFYDNEKLIATQVVEKGSKAIAADVLNVPSDKTFLGWDKCLANVEADFSTNALYQDGKTDDIIITFFDRMGVELCKVVYDENFTAPKAPVIEGKTFVGWSEDLTSVTKSMTVFAMYSDTLLGDANGDNVVNTGDAVAVLRYCANMITLDSNQMISADLTGDGIVNTGDAVAILRQSAGM